MYRLSHKGQGASSFIAETISHPVMSKRSKRGTKYDIVTRAIKLILPSLECDNLFITYLQHLPGLKISLYFEILISPVQNHCKKYA